MVFESVVAELLNRFLGDYVENLDSTQLKIGIWGGDVVLRNLILKQNALDELDLPVKTIYGQLGKLVLKIPWKNLYSAPVEIEIERLFLLAVPNTDIVYNSEKEERWAREAKQAELTRVEEQKQKQRESAEPKPTNDTFIEKLSTNIIKNVQIRIRDIHIRYEDKSDAQIYSMGATLSSLTVVSTDENWIQKISTGDVAHIFKVLQLESLAVYWNTPTEIYSTQSFENICEKLEETIVSSDQIPENFRYILGPICSDARLRLHPKPENDDPKFILPKILLNIEMKTLQIAINEPQYQCIVLFMGSMERMKRGAVYRKYRPAVPFKGHAKEWWRFAYNSILEFEVKRRRQNWNIDHVMNYRKMCKDYACLYKEKMLMKKIPADVPVRLQYYEDKLDLFNIVIARQQVEIEVANQIEIAKQEAAEKSWWGGWFGGSKSKTEEESSNDILKQFEKAMTPEEKKKLYQAIDYTDSNVPIEFPKEYVDMVSAFALHGLVVEIRDKNEKRVLSAHLKGVKCQVQRRPRADAFKLAAKVDAFTVYGTKQNDIRPVLVSSRHVNDSSLMDVQFETNPLHGDCGQRISFKSCPIQIVYDAKTIINVTKIFEPPKDVSLDYLSAVTNMKMQDLKEKSLFGMQYAIEQHTKLDIDINIASPYIVIPYGGFYTGNEPVLIANLGELKLETPESEGYRDIQSRKLDNISDEDLFVEMQKYSYEKYILSLNNFQVIFALPSTKLTEELESGNVVLSDTETNLHLIESTSLKINIGRCLITDDPRLPKIKVSGEIPTVQISASDLQLLMIIALANSIPLPVSQDESDQQVTAATSIASSLSTIPTMASQFTNNLIRTSYEIKKETSDDLIQLTEMEVSFIAKRIDLIVSKHHADVELNCIKEKLEAKDRVIKFGGSKKIFQFSIVGMEFEMTKQTFNQDIVARLGGINYKHFLPNEMVNVLTTPRGDDTDITTLNEENYDYLFSVTFSTVDKKSPEFVTKYQHCEQILFVEIHKIMVILNLDCIKEALKFMNVIQQEMNRIFYVPPTDTDETAEYKTLSQVKRDNMLATINENIELNIKQGLKRRQRKKKSNNVRRIETTLLKIDAQLGEVNVTLQNSIRKLSTFAISGLYLNVDMKKSLIQMSAALKNISIIDPNPLNIHSQILTTIGDETLNLSVIYYTKDVEYETDTDLDLSINVRVGAIRLVFLNWFVASQLTFLNNFQDAQQAIVEASAAAAEQAKQNVQSALEKSLRMKLNVVIKAPDIIVPVHSKSLNALLIDMGVLTLSNKITDTYTKVEDSDTKNEDETEEGQEQRHILVEELRISLENIQISRIHINGANDYSNMKECSILSPTNILLTVQRNLTPNSNVLMPDIDIFGRLEKVQLNLSTTDYKTLMLILGNNLTEGDEFTKEPPKNVSAKPPPKIQQQVSVKTIIEKDPSQTLISEVEIQKKSKTSNVFLQFNFTLHTLDITLFSAKYNSSIDSIERENGLAQFIMSVLSIKGRILHDQTIIASIVLVDCSLDDIRKETNDDDSIRRLLKRNVHDERLLMNYLQNQPKGMLDLTYQQQGEHMFVDLRVFSFELIMAVDYLMLLLQFFTPELNLEHNEEQQSHVQHLTTATGVATKENKPTSVSQQPPAPSNTKTMTVNIRVEQPDIIFVESTLSKNVNAIVLNCEINMKARLSGENHQVINGSMKDLTLYTCKFSRRNQQKNVLHSILKPVCLSIAGSTPAGDDITQGLHVDVIVTDVHLSVSPATIELVNRTLNALTTAKNEQIIQSKNTERDLGNLWDPLIFKDNDFWYLRAEEAEEISEEWMRDISDDPLHNSNKIKRNEMCILNVPSIVVTLEAGVGNQTLPMILLETKLSGMIGNWSSQMYVDCSLSLQINYYNSILAVWEPLIEPKSYSTDGITRKTEPWEIKFEMQIKNTDLQSPLNALDLNDEDRIDEDTNLYQTSQQCILIESKDNLEITISKTCFEVINNMSKAFSNAIQIHDDMVWNVDSAPYSVINDTGVDLVLNIEDTAFMVCDSPNCRQIQIGFGGKVSLELREIEDIKKVTESQCVKTIEQSKEDEGLPKIVHLQVAGARNTIDLPISRADKRYFPLTMEKDPTSKWGIISDIKIINGCTTVCLRSIVQVHNHFDNALDVFYMNENGKSVELIDTISAQGSLNLPLNAVYSPTSEIFFGLRGYTISNTPFIWKDLQLNLAMVKLLECRPKDNKTSKNSFFIRAMGEIEQVYNEITSKHTMISVCYNVHLRPTVSFRNCLPFAITLCISGSIEETVIEPGHVMLLPTVEPDVSQIVIRLDNYLEKTWSCKRKIQNNSPEFSVWPFDSYDSTLKMTLDLGVHKSFHQGSILLALYCPFWMINKTGMMLTYRNNSEDSLNVLYHPENFKGPILFSFNSKNFFGKKKASIRVENGEWSNKFSIDVAGSSGVVTCKYNGVNYQIGVQNQLTYNGLTKQIVFTPLYILINNAPFAIETQEIDRPGDKWITVEENNCTPLWPKGSKDDKLLRIRIVSTQETSAAFLISEVHATLLKLPNKYGGVNVDIQINEGARYITFSRYEAGSAPGLIINHTKYPIKYWEKESINLRNLESYNCILYTWENPSSKRILQCASEYIQPAKMEIENDLRQDGIGEFFVNDPDLNQKVLVYWVSFLDGLQRVLLFTDQQNIAQNAQTAGKYEPISQEINISLHGVGISLVNNILRKDVMYLGIASSGILWETAKLSSTRFKPLSQNDCLLIEAAYQIHLQQLSLNTTVKNSVITLGPKLEVDFYSEMMLKPNKRRLRRTFQTGFWMQLKTSEHQLQLHAKINRLQIDNQLYDCIFPVVLAPVPPPKSVAADTALKPFAELSIVQRIMKHSPVQQFKYFKLLIQEFHVKVDLGFINSILEIVQGKEPSEDETLEYFHTDLKLVDQPLHSHVSTLSLQDQKNFYDLLHFSPLKIHISFSMQTGSSSSASTSSDGTANQSPIPEFLSVVLQGIGVTLTDMHDVVFRLAYFERNFMFYTQKQLISEATQHYVGQLVKQAYVLVLGLDVIGNPYGLVLGISEGVGDLFYEPFQGAIQGPGEFAEGLVLGVRSLFGHTVGGAAGAVSRITGAMGKGIAALSFDEDFQKRRREQINKRPANLQEGLARSGKGLVMGVFDGVTGVFSKPISGAKEQGVEGFFKGLGKGAIGLVARPTAGVVDFASGSLEAVKRCAEGEETSRLRAPRFISNDRRLLPYCYIEAEGNKLLMELEKGKYSNTDVYVYHVWIIQRKEILLLTDKRIAYITHNDIFGGWQVDWSHTWHELQEAPKINDAGMQVIIQEQKKKFNIFGSNSNSKFIPIHDQKLREILNTKIDSIFNNLMSASQISLNRPSI